MGYDDHKELAAQLRELADEVEAMPDNVWLSVDNRVRIPCSSVEEMASMRRSIGGKFDKLSDENYYKLRRTTPSGAEIDIYGTHVNICERKVVGTRTIEVFDIDYTTVPKKMVQEDVYEWVCPETLA